MNEGMKMQVPYLATVLGVGVNEEWRYAEDEAIYRVTPRGYLEYWPLPADENQVWKLSDAIHILMIINQRDLIKRGPLWTETDLALARCLAQLQTVRWLSRDPGQNEPVDLWAQEPKCLETGYDGDMVGSLPAEALPSLRPGQKVDLSTLPGQTGKG